MILILFQKEKLMREDVLQNASEWVCINRVLVFFVLILSYRELHFVVKEEKEFLFANL